MEVIDLVMTAYVMMVNLSLDEEQAAQERIAKFLSGRTEDDNQLVTEGIPISSRR